MTNIHYDLNQLLIYRNILQDDCLQKIQCALSTGNWNVLRYEISHELIKQAEELGLSGNLLQNYVIYLLSRDKNIFSILSEKPEGKIGESLYQAILQDVIILKNFLTALSTLGEDSLLSHYIPTTSTPHCGMTALQESFLESKKDSTPALLVDKLITHYQQHGYGEMADYKAFTWNSAASCLVGVKDYDPISLEDIVGYQYQKTTLLANTEAFLAHKPANNVLLVGDRGTGKSSSVKALANRYFSKGLRLVEVTKHDLARMQDILFLLRSRGKKFILFFDDLSFEEFEVEYKYLKSILEGGVTAKPDNVLIYATSNRRHLIRETWSDRNQTTDEIHNLDTVNEKISLSDRFGITLTYLSPNQEEYLKIVTELARKTSISLSPSELKTQALRWELAHTGRSGRTAQQFISHLLGSAV
jgi:hypothetical protein